MTFITVVKERLKAALRAMTPGRRRSRHKSPLIQFEKWVEHIERLNDYERTFIAVCNFMALLVIDVTTRWWMALEHLYYIPVWLSAWFLNRRATRVFMALAVIRIFIEPAFSPDGWTYADIASCTIHSLVVIASGLVIQGLRDVFDREHQRARMDRLTNVLNTHGFYEAVEAHFQEIRHAFHPFTLIYVDLDHFKQLNDTRGHLEADRALKAVGHVLRQATRKPDIVGRMGGDEFAIILRNTGADMGFAVAERLRKRLDAEMKRRGWFVTASVGCMAFHSTPTNVHTALNATDELMYRAKNAGRAQVATAVYQGDRRHHTRAVVSTGPLVASKVKP